MVIVTPRIGSLIISYHIITHYVMHDCMTFSWVTITTNKIHGTYPSLPASSSNENGPPRAPVLAWESVGPAHQPMADGRKIYHRENGGTVYPWDRCPLYTLLLVVCSILIQLRLVSYVSSSQLFLKKMATLTTSYIETYVGNSCCGGKA